MRMQGMLTARLRFRAFFTLQSLLVCALALGTVIYPKNAEAHLERSWVCGETSSNGYIDPSGAAYVTGYGCYWVYYDISDEHYVSRRNGEGDESGAVHPQGAGSKHTSRNTAPAAKKANDPNPCPGRTGDPVILSSGAKVDSIIDFSEPGEMGLTFERYYNSRYMCGTNASCLGTGAWTTNLDYYLDTSCPPPDPSDPRAPCPPAQFHRPDGSALSFRIPISFYGTPGSTASTGTGTLTNNGDGTYTLHDEDARILVFNTQGLLLAIKDSLGIGWTLTRPDANTLVVTHTNGQSFKLVVNNPNASYGVAKQIQVTDPAGHVYTYQSIAMSYDGYSNPVSHLGALTSVALPGSPSTVIAYKYLPDNTTTGIYAQLTEVDYNGVAHDLTTYDSAGRANMTSLADGSGRISIAYGSNATGPTATVTSPLSQVSVYQFNSAGLLVSISGQAGAGCAATYATNTYDANGFMASSTDNNGNVTQYTYDASGLLQQKIEAAGTSVQRTTDYAWDTVPGTPRLLSITVEGWSKTTYTYDGQNYIASEAVTNLSSHGNANQALTTTYNRTFYGNGLVHTITVTHPSNSTDVYTYDAFDRLISVTDSLGHTATYSNYNAMGEPGTVVGPNGDQTDYTYDERGRLLTRTIHPNGTTATWSYTYDGFGLLATETDPDGKIIMWDRDATMRVGVIARTEKDGDSTETIGYDANGDVTSDVIQRGSDIGLSQTMSYDGLGRLHQKTGQHGQKLVYSYDGNGNVASVANAAGHVVSYQYDALNRVTKVVESGGATLGAPSVSLSTGNSTTGSYTATWTAIAGAASYTLQEQLNGGAWSTAYTGNATSTPFSGKTNGTYSYRVQACNPGGCGDVSDIASVSVLLPPPAPASVSVPATSSGSLTVSWVSSSTATSYALEHQSNGGAWSGLYTGSATSFALTEAVTGSYVYRVKACNTSGCGSYATSSTVAVTIPPSTAPSLSVPSVSGTGSYTVSWSAAGGATSYTVQEQVNGGSWTTTYNGAATNQALSGRSNGATYGYQVRACNAGGCGPWSAIQSVQVIFPPAAPTNAHETMMGSVKVIYNRAVWDAMPTATGYDVTLDGNPTVVYSGPNTYYIIGSATNPDEPDGTHTAFVRACNAGGCSGWTKVPPYDPPAPPKLTGPSASNNGAYTLSWNSVSPLVDYYVLQQQINGGSWATVYSGLNLSMAFSGQADGTYGYQIQSCIVNTCGGWSTITVTVARPPGTPASISVPATSSGSLSASWSGVAGASSYTLEHQLNGGAWGAIFSGNATSTAVTEGSNGTYVYRVKACNVGGCGGYQTSGAVTVTLPAAPPAPASAGITSRGSYKVVTYTASWSAVSGATYYQAVRGDTGAQVYSGTATSYVIGSGSPDAGPEYGSFSVRACNASGCSGWTVGYGG